MDDYKIVSLSGGKDSTAMLLMMLENNRPFDEIIYFDTGWEFPQMIEHIDKLEANIEVPITRLKPPKTFDYYLFDHVLSRGKRQGQCGYGFARSGSRWCTQIKKWTIEKYLKSQARGRPVVEYIGIAADEQHRIKDKAYPLVEWGITENDALQYCLNKGYNWGGLYEHFDRVSCWCCPLQSLSDLRNIRRHYPELWNRLLDMDAHSYNGFRYPKSLTEIHLDFEHEDNQISLF